MEQGRTRSAGPRWLLAGLLAGAALLCPAATPAYDRPLVFGVNPVAEYGLFGHDPTYRDQVWETLRRIGSTAVRLDASWRDIEAERGVRDWSYLDDAVHRAVAIGAEPVLLIVNTPGWASPTGQPVHDYPPKEEAAPEFEDFCRELARRTLGQVRYFEIWNEQNGWGWHVDRGFQRADEYLPWLRRAYYALKSANPDCLVAVGGMDDAAGHAPAYMEKLYRYRDEWYPGEELFDAVADHPYSHTVEGMQEKIERLMDVLRANGDGHKKLWLTEYGWQLRDVGVEHQAREIQRTLDYLTSEEGAVVEIATHLCIADFERHWLSIGLCDANLRPRPAFALFRDHPRHEKPYQHDVRIAPTGPGAFEVAWRTRTPARTQVLLRDARERAVPASAEPATDHRAVIANTDGPLAQVQPVATADGLRDVVPWQPVAVAQRGVVNGDFEAGFAAGIAHGWRIEGPAFCYDAALLPLRLVHSGTHAQALVAETSKGQGLRSTVQGAAIVPVGTPLELRAWTCGLARTDPGHMPRARIGVRPAGEAGETLWSAWVEEQYVWTESRVAFVPSAEVVDVYIEAEADDPASGAEYLLYIDDVSVSPQ